MRHDGEWHQGVRVYSVLRDVIHNAVHHRDSILQSTAMSAKVIHSDRLEKYGSTKLPGIHINSNEWVILSSVDELETSEGIPYRIMLKERKCSFAHFVLIKWPWTRKIEHWTSSLYRWWRLCLFLCMKHHDISVFVLIRSRESLHDSLLKSLEDFGSVDSHNIIILCVDSQRRVDTGT